MAAFYRFFRVFLLLSLLGVGAVVVPLKIFDADGIERVERLSRELDALQEGDAALKRQNELLRKRIRAFHADADYIERVARDELGMVGPNEVVYQFPSVD